MKRRDILKKMLLGATSARAIAAGANEPATRSVAFRPAGPSVYASNWQAFPDMTWLGPEWWAQRLQDWYIAEGELRGIAAGPDRTVHLLTHQLSAIQEPITLRMKLRFADTGDVRPPIQVGFRLGGIGRFDDYRSAIFTGKGIDFGIDNTGILFIGDKKNGQPISVGQAPLELLLTLRPVAGDAVYAKLSVLDVYGNTLDACNKEFADRQLLVGNIALLLQAEKSQPVAASYAIALSDFRIEGESLTYAPEQTYGPIYFAQYTLSNGVIKLTAQLAPTDQRAAKAILECQFNGTWKKMGEASPHPLARTASFRIENWQHTQSVPYRIVYTIPLLTGKPGTWSYEGSIAAEPTAEIS